MRAIIVAGLLACSTAHAYELTWAAFKAAPERHVSDPAFIAYLDGLLWAAHTTAFQQGARCMIDRGTLISSLQNAAKGQSGLDQTQGPLAGSTRLPTLADAAWGEIVRSCRK